MENKDKKEENKIDSIKYLMDLGIKEVSNRTFIHEKELESFLSGNFENINKTKAFGFIQILQREFHVDLSDLKNKYITYTQEHKTNEPKIKESLIMEEVKSEERKKSFFSIFFLLLAIGAIAYLIDKYDLLNFSKPATITTASEREDSKKIDLNKLQTNQETKIEQKVKTTKKENVENKLDLSNVLEEHKDAKPKQEATNQNQDNDNQNLDLSKLNDDLSTNDDTINTAVADANTTDQENNSTNQDAISNNELYIVPNSKVWIGTIDLDTFKKHDFLAKKGEKVDIDTSKNQLIMIGHKFIKITLNGEIVNFKRKGPIRFKYIDGNLEEINRREFNSLAKGRQW